MITHRKPRILVVAPACNPTHTSVPLIGYQVAAALARRRDVSVEVVTAGFNRADLSSSELASATAIHYVESNVVTRTLDRLAARFRGGSGLGWTVHTAAAWPTHVRFEFLVYRMLRSRLAAGEFDLIHRVTPVTSSVGSPLVGLTRVPVVIGPLNGGLRWPVGFMSLRRAEGEWMAPFRPTHRLLPFHRATLRDAAAVLAGGRTISRELGRGHGLRVYFPENGIDPVRFPIADRWPEPAGRFRFVTVGRCVPCKSVDLILEAMAASAALRNTELVVVGDGPTRGEWEALAERLGLGGSVTFSGWLPNSEVARVLRNTQAFVFPSVREFGGGAILEAMTAALPSVVTGYGGPAELVTPESGMTIPLGRRADMIAGFRAAMEDLASDSDKCRSMGRAAAAHVAGFTWDAKANRLVELYRQVLNRGNS